MNQENIAYDTTLKLLAPLNRDPKQVNTYITRFDAFPALDEILGASPPGSEFRMVWEEFRDRHADHWKCRKGGVVGKSHVPDRLITASVGMVFDHLRQFVRQDAMSEWCMIPMQPGENWHDYKWNWIRDAVQAGEKTAEEVRSR